jgi:hypothetical protein
MLRIGAMNLMLHGVEHPTVEYRDSLSDQGEHNISDKYTLILANPPFKGSVAYDELSPDLLTALGKSPKKTTPKAEKPEYDEDGNLIEKNRKKGPSEKTELLFLALILRMLQPEVVAPLSSCPTAYCLARLSPIKRFVKLLSKIINWTPLSRCHRVCLNPMRGYQRPFYSSLKLTAAAPIMSGFTICRRMVSR